MQHGACYCNVGKCWVLKPKFMLHKSMKAEVLLMLTYNIDLKGKPRKTVAFSRHKHVERRFYKTRRISTALVDTSLQTRLEDPQYNTAQGGKNKAFLCVESVL